MKAVSKVKLKLISFLSPEINNCKNATEMKAERKKMINLVSISKEEIEKNRSSKYQYAL